MFTKFIAKRFVSNLISEALKQLPDVKDRILNDLAEHKDEIIKGILEHIKSAVIDFLKKRVGK